MIDKAKPVMLLGYNIIFYKGEILSLKYFNPNIKVLKPNKTLIPVSIYPIQITYFNQSGSAIIENAVFLSNSTI